MSHFVRYCMFRRATKLFREESRIQSSRGIHQFSRLLFPDRFEDKKVLSPSSSGKPEDDVFPEDLIKFPEEGKINLPRSTVKSEDFSIGHHDDPNTFGTLSSKNPYLLTTQEGNEDDQAEENFISELPNYLPQKKYADMIKKYLFQRRFADALNVLEVTMLKEHRVKPEYYIYSILIAYCGRTGYSKMAFKLYNEMKRRDLPVKSSVYTSLFNAYANSPYPADGLKRTKHLLRIMNEKGITPNEINFNAIIKAFGRCGAVEEAFKTADLMMQKKMKLKAETFSFLFHACISDTDAGFRHAILIYRKMLEYRITPNAIHFNLLLHCLRECSIGNLDSMIDTLKRIGVEDVDQLTSSKPTQPSLSSGYPWEEDQEITAKIVSGSSTHSHGQVDSSTTKEVRTSQALLPNLLSRHPTLGCIVSLTEIVTPQDRLFLLGGVEGLLKEMKRQDAKPDIKTLNLLLDCSPETYTAEQVILKIISKYKLQPDLLFFNSLIRRRCFRQQYAEAKEVLSLITSQDLRPDLMTFTNLAMACRNIDDAYELLKTLDDSGLRPGIELMNNLFGCACISNQMKYVQLVFDVIEYEEMKVNSRFLKKTDSFYEKCQRILKIRPEKFNPKFLPSLSRFCKMYIKWKENIGIEDESKDPWKHFKERHSTGSATDEEFFGKYVEKKDYGAKFSRLGPNTAPKTYQAKVKRMKEETPELFEGRHRHQKRTEVEKLEGISSVTFQQMFPKES